MKKSKSPLLRIIQEAKPIAWWIVLCGVIATLSIGLTVAIPKVLGKITDALCDYEITGNAIDKPTFIKNCLILIVLYFLSTGLNLSTMAIMNNTVSMHYTCTLRIKISEKIKTLTIKDIDNAPNGDFIARLTNDVGHMGGTLHELFDLLLSGVLKLAFIVTVIFMTNPAMATIVIIFVPLSVAFSCVMSIISRKQYNKARKDNGMIYALTEEAFTGFDTVKAFGLEESRQQLQGKLSDDFKTHMYKGNFNSGIVSPIITLMNNLLYVVICIIGGVLIVDGKLGFITTTAMTVGTVVEFIMYSNQLAGPLENFAFGVAHIQNSLAAATRVFELIDREEKPENPTEVLSSTKGDVAFDNVEFSYVPEKPLIKNLSFSAKKGQKIAIVGPTGAGKTTIINLLMRFYEVDDGKIFIDGVDTANISLENLHDNISMVLQDTWLFSGTIKENIAYGKQNATDEEIVWAAKKAHIDRYIEGLPDGYDTVINEETTNISGGQKQLLTIARAYLSNKSILVLDEATSNVDTRTELLIQESMDELMKNKTSFVIAHRLSTIVNADLILVVKDGQIVEQGTHKSLMEKNGFYSEIYNSQYAILK